MQEERNRLAKELSSLREQRDRLKAELEKYKECDPQVVEEIRKFVSHIEDFNFANERDFVPLVAW